MGWSVEAVAWGAGPLDRSGQGWGIGATSAGGVAQVANGGEDDEQVKHEPRGDEYLGGVCHGGVISCRDCRLTAGRSGRSGQFALM